MDKTQDNRLPKVIKFILDLIFGLLIFVIIGLVIWMIISPILANKTDTLGIASFPVTVGTGDIPSMEVSFQGKSRFFINNAFVEEAKGTLRLETKSPLLIIIANSGKLAIAVGFAYIFYLLRKVMDFILEGNPFAVQNSQIIRRLGYAVLVVGFVGSILDGLASWYILNQLPATVPAMQARTTFDPRLILANALFIFLLAQIWGYGMELERDRSLTI